MSEKPDNPFAFPVEPGSSSLSSGMTLRDWFAGQALHGLIASEAYRTSPENDDVIARRAYALADALLSERGRD